MEIFSKKIPPPRWSAQRIQSAAAEWLQQQRPHHRGNGDRSPWWDFVYRWPREVNAWIADFMAGTYQFAPRIRYHFSDETLEVWEYRDRLMLSLLLGQIKSTFSHLVSSVCCHLQGPSGVKTAITGIQNALADREFQYVIRADIRSYYASIDRKILLRQIQESFDDPRVFNYLNAIITAPIDDGGHLLTPDHGIPRRSSGFAIFWRDLFIST